MLPCRNLWREGWQGNAMKKGVEERSTPRHIVMERRHALHARVHVCSALLWCFVYAHRPPMQTSCNSCNLCLRAQPYTRKTPGMPSTHSNQGFDFFLKNQAFAAWKGLSPLGCSVTVHFVLAGDARLAGYWRELGVLEQN